MTTPAESPSRRPILSDESPFLLSFAGALMFVVAAVLACFTLLPVSKRLNSFEPIFMVWGIWVGVIAYALSGRSRLGDRPLLASLIWVEFVIAVCAFCYSGARLGDFFSLKWMTLKLFWKPSLYLSLPWIAGLWIGRLVELPAHGRGRSDGTGGADVGLERSSSHRE